MEFASWTKQILSLRVYDRDITGKDSEIIALIRFSTSGTSAPWRACHACFLILYTVTARFPWECTESVPRIDQGFTLPIAVTRERSDRPSLSFSKPFRLAAIVSIVDRLLLIISRRVFPTALSLFPSLFSVCATIVVGSRRNNAAIFLQNFCKKMGI